MVLQQVTGPRDLTSDSEVFAKANDVFSGIIVRSDTQQLTRLPPREVVSEPSGGVLNTKPYFGFGSSYELRKLQALLPGLTVAGLFCLVFFLGIGTLKLAFQAPLSGTIFSIAFLMVVLLFVARMLGGIFGSSEPLQLKILKLLDLHLGRREESDSPSNHQDTSSFLK